MSITMNSIKDRVEILERWKWMIVGAAVALGYVVGHMDIFNKVFGG
jgi:hypothetical protein